MTEPIPFLLTAQEKASPLWRRLREHLQRELETARAKNDDTTLTEQQTATLRGRIASLRGLLALEDEPPQDG